MPVCRRRIDDMWRIVECESGRIATTPKGTARDGGGHESEAKARAQQRAINRTEGES